MRFPIKFFTWNPGFDIEHSKFSCAHIARANFDHAVMELEVLKNFFRGFEEQLVKPCGFFGIVFAQDVLLDFMAENKTTAGIIGIYVHTKRINVKKRPIHKTIHKQITSGSCVVCGTSSDIVCDHKNDLYNDDRVLDVTTQSLDDFQPLCNHCNLQKRQVCKDEERMGAFYSAKQIARYRKYEFEFPWEKKAYDRSLPSCKTDTYWYDPVEFDRKIYCYMMGVLPVVRKMNQHRQHREITEPTT
jgi:hypothetical protein